MLTASQVYTYTRRILDAYAAVMQPLSAELDMAQNAVDILLFLANNPGLDTARDICTYRKLKPGIVSFHVDNLVREGYLLRDYHGRLAVVKAGEETPEMIFDVYTKTLPEADQSMLAEGIYVESYEELLSLIEDYVS